MLTFHWAYFSIYWSTSFKVMNSSVSIEYSATIMGLLLFDFFSYCFLLLSLSSIFSIGLFGSIISLTSDNFECGFYPILSSMLKYKINYWMITIHFLIFEQELILVLLLTFGLKTLNENNLLFLLLGILFIIFLVAG